MTGKNILLRSNYLLPIQKQSTRIFLGNRRQKRPGPKSGAEKAGCAAASARSDAGGAAQDGVPVTIVGGRKSAASPAAQPGIGMIARRARCDADANMTFLTG
ncbi:hypothetical protein [Burkholderia ubonensis]|uniref:hypothetical protein n=1 Tax=Burkholderia ubonensis TaxID=101571 RepID=UPI001584043F|nr:hypothetical protein [Burkholderia ubonensis]